jgi:hypothetical protein
MVIPPVAGRLGAQVRQLSVNLNLQALSLAEGLRAALSVASIIAVNETLQWPPLIEAAPAASNTCLCDPGGPIRRRIPVLLVFTLLGALIVGGVELTRGGAIAVALPLGILGLCCATFVRIYGETPQLVGVLLGAVLILALDRPLPNVEQTAVPTVFIGAGRARRTAGVASNSLAASLSRAPVECVKGSGAASEAARVIEAALRRCAGRATAIMFDSRIRTARSQPVWTAWWEWIARSSAALAAGSVRLDARPAAATEAVARIGWQLELIAGTLERLPR